MAATFGVFDVSGVANQLDLVRSRLVRSISYITQGLSCFLLLNICSLSTSVQEQIQGEGFEKKDYLFYIFNDAFDMFLRLYGKGSLIQRGNPLHEVVYPIGSKGYFIYIIPQTG